MTFLQQATENVLLNKLHTYITHLNDRTICKKKNVKISLKTSFAENFDALWKIAKNNCRKLGLFQSPFDYLS
jgi:hypothetical protein